MPSVRTASSAQCGLSDERDNIYRILADAIVAFEVEDDGEAVTEE